MANIFGPCVLIKPLPQINLALLTSFHDNAIPCVYTSMHLHVL